MSARPRRAVITGVTGQDGSLLAEQLLARGYEVVGVTRRAPGADLGLGSTLAGAVGLIHGALADSDTLAAIRTAAPDELYHLAAPTFVPDSWTAPADTMRAIYGSTAAVLGLVAEALPATRAFVAGSAEMFGEAPESPQRETTPCRPRSPYGTAKLAAHQLVAQVRAHAGVFAVSGILYNHESPRRPERFVTRKVTRGVAEIALGRRERLSLGDLSAVRDWSDAGDVMHGAWLALQHDTADDYVLASGVGHTVADLVRVAFAHAGLHPDDHVEVDAELRRGPEPVAAVGDPTRARETLRWTETTTFEQLIGRMVDADLAALT